MMHALGCLRDRTLAVLAEGDGSPRQRLHLVRCARCRARHASMIDARALAAVVLRDATLHAATASVAVGARTRDGLRWLTPLAATAGLAAVLVFGWRVPSQTARGLAADARDAFSLDDVSQDAFALDEASPWLEADADATGWEAALRGEWPCEAQGVLTNDPHCN
jgi:hypothetical protein